MAQIEELNSNTASFDSTEQIQNVVMFLQCSGALSKHVESFMQMLSLVQANGAAQFILTPILSDESSGANFLRCSSHLKPQLIMQASVSCCLLVF